MAALIPILIQVAPVLLDLLHKNHGPIQDFLGKLTGGQRNPVGDLLGLLNGVSGAGSTGSSPEVVAELAKLTAAVQECAAALRLRFPAPAQPVA